MNQNNNPFQNLYQSEKERLAIVGDETIKLRSFSALRNLLYCKMDNHFLLFVQSAFLIIISFMLSFIWFLKKSNYSVVANNEINPEFLYVGYSLFGIGVILAAIFAYSKLSIKVGTSLILSVFLYFQITSVYYNPHIYFSNFDFLINPMFSIALVFFGIFFILSLFFWRYLFFIAFSCLTFFAISLSIDISKITNHSIPTPIKDTKNTSNNIIHIAIDNHINLKYLSELESSNDLVANTSEKIKNIYSKYGFNLYLKAFSDYASPLYETNYIVNLGTANKQNINEKKLFSYININNGIDYTLTDKAYFKMIKDNNYNVNIYQGYGANLCSHNDFNCFMYYPINNVNSKKQLLFAYLNYLTAPNILNNLMSFYKLDTLPYNEIETVTSQNEILNKAKEDIINAKGNNFFFIKLSSLKKPYSYDNICNPSNPTSDVKGYDNQLSCLYLKIDEFLASLKEKGVFENSKIIITGIGGSKILSGVKNSTVTVTVEKAAEMVKDYYMTVYAEYKNNSTHTINTDLCNVNSLLLRSLSNNDNIPCTSISIESFSPESYQRFNELLLKWLDTF